MTYLKIRKFVLGIFPTFLRVRISYIKYLFWFTQKVSYWPHLINLLLSLVKKNNDTLEIRKRAFQWALKNSDGGDLEEILKKLNLNNYDPKIHTINNNFLEDAQQLKKNSKTEMGGMGDLNLIYSIARMSDSKYIIETGVAYGFSSLAILLAIKDNGGGNLVSVDMPYPYRNHSDDVGIVVSKNLYDNWCLIKEPDRNGLIKAINHLNREIDLFHYDSDKSYNGRMFAYPLMYNALKMGGILISDDIQDNFAFRDFVLKEQLNFTIKSYDNKFIGIVIK